MAWLKSRFVQIGILVVLIVGVLIAYNSLTFRLSSSAPSNNQKGVLIDQLITLTFSKPLGDLGQTKVNVNDRQIDNFEGNDQTLTINISLLPYTEYRVSVSNIVSSGGKTINQVLLTFVTGDLSSQAKQIKQDFIASLPITKDSFSIDYTVNSNTVNVEILTGPIEDTKKSALAFLAQYYITEATDSISFFAVPAVSGNPGP